MSPVYEMAAGEWWYDGAEGPVGPFDSEGDALKAYNEDPGQWT